MTRPPTNAPASAAPTSALLPATALPATSITIPVLASADAPPPAITAAPAQDAQPATNPLDAAQRFMAALQADPSGQQAARRAGGGLAQALASGTPGVDVLLGEPVPYDSFTVDRVTGVAPPFTAVGRFGGDLAPLLAQSSDLNGDPVNDLELQGRLLERACTAGGGACLAQRGNAAGLSSEVIQGVEVGGRTQKRVLRPGMRGPEKAPRNAATTDKRGRVQTNHARSPHTLHAGLLTAREAQSNNARHQHHERHQL